MYGGGADGHVYEDARVIINNGTIDRSVYGGGAGEGTHKVYLWEPDPDDGDGGNNIERHRVKQTQDDVHSWTAGKVYGNTYVTIYIVSDTTIVHGYIGPLHEDAPIEEMNHLFSDSLTLS